MYRLESGRQADVCPTGVQGKRGWGGRLYAGYANCDSESLVFVNDVGEGEMRSRGRGRRDERKKRRSPSTVGSVLLGVIVHLGNSTTNPNRRGTRWEGVGWGEAGCAATRMRHEAEAAALRPWARRPPARAQLCGQS